VPFSIALRGGGDIRTEAGLDNRTSVFCAGDRLASVRPQDRDLRRADFVTNAGRTLSGQKSVALFTNAGNVPVGFAVVLTDALSVVGELIPKNRDLPPTFTATTPGPSASSAHRGITSRFWSPTATATHADQYVSSTYMGSPLTRATSTSGSTSRDASAVSF